MTIALREPSPTPVVAGTMPTIESEVVDNLGPVHCGASMRITGGPVRSTMWAPLAPVQTMDSVEAVKPIWPEWACGCGFRMDVDATHPMKNVWMAALRRQRLQYELAIAQDTFELALNRAAAAGVEPFALAQAAGCPPGEIETILQ